MTAGLRMTPEDYAAFLRKRASGEQAAAVAPPVPVAPTVPVGVSTADAKVLRAHAAKERFQALGRLPKGEMNKTEAAYAEFLEERKRLKQIVWWKFHPMNVRLANNTFYEVDWLLMTADMHLEIHETKGGFTTDKGQLKLKLCGDVLPVFRMLKVIKLPKKQGGGWEIKDYSA